MPIVLFDIDGTLIRTGRAGSRAMNRAFDDLFGIAGAFDGIEMAGRTDRWILDDAAARASVDLSGDNFERFRDRYFACRLDGRVPRPQRKGVCFQVCTGFSTRSTRREMYFSALLTGNCEEGARIKLEHFDLWKFFRCGAFGDDVTDRNHLFDIALHRAEACGAPRVQPSDVVVVGDTVLDVACAKAAGARSVAVATGPFDVETLLRAGRRSRDAAILSDTRRVPSICFRYRSEVRRRCRELRRRGRWIPAPGGAGREDLTLYETNISGARPLLRFLRSEFHALAFAKQLENSAADGAAMKEVFDSSLIADKPETLVDQKPCDRAGRHARVLRMFPAVAESRVTSWRSGLWEPLRSRTGPV